MLLMKVGTYIGDGSGSNRAITGIGFQPKVVIVTGPSSGSQIRIDSMPANNSKALDQPNSFVTTGIRSLDSDGFTVSPNGTQSTSLNFSAIVYHYIAFGGNSTDIATGTYLGNGSDNRSVVTGLSFQPDWVGLTRPDDYLAQRTSAISSGTDLTWYMGTFSAIANAIQSIASDGFTVGTDGSANSNGVNFYWFAIKGAAGKIEFGSYTGDGSSSRSITGVTTFEPDAVIVTPRDSQYSVWRSDLMGSTNSLITAQNNAVLTNGIGSFLSTGFDVLSASANVNQNTLTYYFIALINVSSTVEVDVTKSLKYCILKKIDLTKSAKYSVQSEHDVTKSAKYSVQSEQGVTKQTIYTIVTEHEITKSGQYAVSVDHAVTKDAEYQVQAEFSDTKDLEYLVQSPSEVTKDIGYQINNSNEAMKSLKYCVIVEASVTKSLKYTIITEGAATKSLRYTVADESEVQKTVLYKVQSEHEVQKSTHYAVQKEATGTTLSLDYVVGLANGTMLSLKYCVVDTGSTTKALIYSLVSTQPLTKSARYAVRSEDQQARQIVYRINQIVTINKSVYYEVSSGISGLILKGLEYHVENTNTVRRNKVLTYVVGLKYPYTRKKILPYGSWEETSR